MASLGLVAYGSSDEEGSDVEDTQENDQNGEVQKAGKVETSKPAKGKPAESTDDDIHISDEEDYPQTNTASVLNLPSSSWKFLNLPPPSSVKPNEITEDPMISLQPNRASLNSVQAPLTGPQLEEDIVKSASTLLPGLPVPKMGDRSGVSENTPAGYTYDDELEEVVKPKDWEKNAPKPPPKAKKRQPVKITAPALFDNSDDEDEPKAKQPAVSRGKTKLFSMLPEPKNVVVKEANRSLIPHTLSKKPAASGKPPVKKVPPSRLNAVNVKTTIMKPTVVPAKVDIIGQDSDDEEDAGPVNFFDIGQNDDEPQNRTTSTFSFRKDESIGPLLPQSELGQDEVSPMETEVMPGPTMMPDEDEEYEPYGGEVQQYLQDEEFLKIQGKKHRGKEEINIIDVNVADQLDKSELMKTLSEEQQMSSHSRKRKDMPTSQQRRKHQITYLAFQAKERELELKNQWSANRQTRKQTQSKYGF